MVAVRVDESVEAFSAWLKAFRVTGMNETQEEFARHIGAHAVTVGKWESGANAPHPFFYERLVALAEQHAYILPPMIDTRRRGPRRHERETSPAGG